MTIQIRTEAIHRAAIAPRLIAFTTTRAHDTRRRARPHIATAALIAGMATMNGTVASDRDLDTILEPIAVTDRVYYFYGSLENRTPINQGMNANLGFVVTDEGVVLVDSGPGARVAERIEAAVAMVTEQPVRLVVNIGSQDHRWLGNGYFADQGAEIVALSATAATQAGVGPGILERMRDGVGSDATDETVLFPAPRPIETDRHDFEFGGVAFSLRHAADAHFPGDAFLYLPDESVVFTGDIVYTERMLGIHPFSDPAGQLAAFQAIEALEPRHIVPGHGAATDLAEARRDTGDYLETILKGVQLAIDEWESIDTTIERLAELDAFRHLRHYDAWHRRNVHATYLFLESQTAP